MPLRIVSENGSGSHSNKYERQYSKSPQYSSNHMYGRNNSIHGTADRGELFNLTQNRSGEASPPRPSRKIHRTFRLNSIFEMGKKVAGRQVLCTHRRVTPALGARLLRSYVPLRYGPSESGCANNTCLPADTLLVRKIRIYNNSSKVS